MLKNNKFAFLVYPENFQRLYSLLGKSSWLIQRLPEFTLKKIIAHLPPFRVLEINNIQSECGARADGLIILLPLLPSQFVSIKSEVLHKRIIDACSIGKKWGARIVGLAGFTSIFSNQGLDLMPETDIALTTGNSYTSALVLDSIFKAAEASNYKMQDLSVAIYGATGDIGNICSSVLAKYAKKMYLIARNDLKLREFANRLYSASSADIRIAAPTDRVLNEADIVITATSATTAIIDPRQLKSGAIVCDVSMPPNIARNAVESRKDVLIYEGGYAQLPRSVNIKRPVFLENFPLRAVFGCLAETIILAFEGRYENFSIGRGNITEKKINEIKNLGEKHGFQVAPFFCNNKLVDLNSIKRLGRQA